MHIKWDALAQTAGLSFAITVAVVAAFALGILALSRREAAQEAVRSGIPGAAAATWPWPVPRSASAPAPRWSSTGSP
ncbi:hypothetical protein ACFQ1I_28685 [Kitasatospora arboriphila]